MNEMESMRIDEELHKQKMTSNHLSFNRFSKDSGVVDLDLLKPGDPGINRLSAPEYSGLKKSALSNSLIELSESSKRRGSGGSLDSGLMSAAVSSFICFY
jgi:IQ motif/SEC7 domain-containing protein